MAQGGGKKLKKLETKRDLTKVRRKQQKPTRGKIAPIKNPHLLQRNAVKGKLTRMINKSIEEKAIERINYEKPGSLILIKSPDNIKPVDNIKRRKLVQKTISKSQ